jgi:hypothetical protein
MKQTYDFPNLLIDATVTNGFPVHTVRHGGSLEIEHNTAVEFVSGERPPAEVEFRILAPNRISFGGQTTAVLNDAMDYGDQHLEASVPSLSEYQALIGQEVMIKFDRYEQIVKAGDPKKWKVARTFITLQ